MWVKQQTKLRIKPVVSPTFAKDPPPPVVNTPIPYTTYKRIFVAKTPKKTTVANTFQTCQSLTMLSYIASAITCENTLFLERSGSFLREKLPIN